MCGQQPSECVSVKSFLNEKPEQKNGTLKNNKKY